MQCRIRWQEIRYLEWELYSHWALNLLEIFLSLLINSVWELWRLPVSIQTIPPIALPPNDYHSTLTRSVIRCTNYTICHSIAIVQSISTHEYAEQRLTRGPKKFCITVNRTFTIFIWSHGQCSGRCILCFFLIHLLVLEDGWYSAPITLLKKFQLLRYCNFSSVRRLLMKEIAAITWLTLPVEGHAPWGCATQLRRANQEWGWLNTVNATWELNPFSLCLNLN